ncbi:hypothetical protein LWF15_09265 [Kineosporia rhizophila]|uniref:hypothetical protein n=1 Tax=Kineosporia TaxID=49184 RepID=UPI001E3EC33E|nr:MULTISPECIES: hypothetical protein [Kineosporia]MCE0535701.1 hypothetical protein [Kineosporia rhizophila]GLY17650.1 membrane protein [Kineosporia sp. NBRC 101677]
MLLGLGSALVAAVMYGVGSIMQARASREIPEGGLTPGTVIGLLRQPLLLASILLLLLGYVFHLVSVRHVPLFLAQTGIAVSLVVTALLAVRYFGDRLSRLEWGAIVAVVAGLVLLSASAGETGTERATPALTTSLFVVLALIVVVVFFATRFEGALAAAVLGLAGGMGYAIVAIASRLLPDFVIADLITSASTYALVASGVLAFFIYSLALQRGSVTAATTSLITTQTIAPTIAGVAFLGDEVREGYWPLFVVGFLLTAVAAAVLVRFEGIGDPVREADDDADPTHPTHPTHPAGPGSSTSSAGAAKGE